MFSKIIKRIIRITILISLSTLMFYLYFLKVNNKLPKLLIQPSSNKETNSQEYNINSIDTTLLKDNTENYSYPTVNIHPNKKIYLFIYLKELWDLKNNNYDNLFMANKRIAELKKWGNSIPVSKENKTLIYTESLWKINKPQLKFVFLYQYFNSWKTILTRYEFSIMNYLLKLSLDQFSDKVYIEKLIDLKNNISFNQKTINITINNLSLPKDKKVILKNFSNQVFKQL